MLKFLNTDIVFQEVPNETSLAINITHCPCHCPGCHSPYLWKDIGEELNDQALYGLVDRYKENITCVCFMGGDTEPQEVERLALRVKEKYEGMKVAWYSGRQYVPTKVKKTTYDYIKVGPYNAHLGPLSSKKTNQRMLKKREDGTFEDITSVFQRKRED